MMTSLRTSFFDRADSKFGAAQAFTNNLRANIETNPEVFQIEMKIADPPNDERMVIVHFLEPIRELNVGAK